MELLITKHAQDMMNERSIEEQQIKITIQRGSRIRQTDGYLACYTYLRIAYKILKDGRYKIKTVMLND